MKRIIPFVVIFITIFIFFKSFFLYGQLPIPSDTIVGLYNPFRDFYAKQYPIGIPFKNFLITDPVRQEYPWRNLAIGIEKTGQLPLWNKYSFAGTPLMANFQSAALYPLNIIFFIVPFSLGWSILVLLQPLLAGAFLYLYLQKMGLSKSASILGSITWILSGFFIAWLEWNTILHVILWLPLILLLKEILIEKFQLRWAILLVLVESTAIFAGHLQTLFYSLIVSNVYLWLRIMQVIWQEKSKKNILILFIEKYWKFLVLGVVVYAITAIQWYSTFQFIALSARDIDQANWMQPGWFIPWEHSIQFLIPDFFGNPATLNYWGVWNYAEFIGYIGIIPLIFALTACIYRRDKKTLFFGSFFILSLLFAFPTPLAKLPFILQIPFISTAQPTRLLFITDFSLAILSALGFDYFIQQRKRIFLPLGLITIALGVLWMWILLPSHFGIQVDIKNILIAKRNIYLPTLLIVGSIIVFTLFNLLPKKKIITNVFILVIFILISVDLLRFAQKFIPFTNPSYLFPQTNSIKFLQQQPGEFRIMTTDSRLLAPDFSVMYQLQSIDGYDPLYLKYYGELIAASERGKPDIKPPFGFNRIITPHNYDSPIIDLLGVKYILSLSELPNTYLKKVYQEGETKIYENNRSLPRVFFVKHVLAKINNEAIIQAMYQSQLKDTAIIADEKTLQEDVAVGNITNIQYFPNSLQFTTQNQSSGFVVLTDIFYPTWHATIDGKPTRIYRTDYAFRGLFVPSGKHTIVLTNSIF